MKPPGFPTAMILIASLLTGCVEDGGEPTETVPYVDLERFMGIRDFVGSVGYDIKEFKRVPHRA